MYLMLMLLTFLVSDEVEVHSIVIYSFRMILLNMEAILPIMLHVSEVL